MKMVHALAQVAIEISSTVIAPWLASRYAASKSTADV